jgi:hypothetical protein
MKALGGRMKPGQNSLFTTRVKRSRSPYTVNNDWTLLRPRTDTPRPLQRVVHHIDTGSAAPVFARPWWLDPKIHLIVETEFLALEKAGIIRRSNSPWASPHHLVPKKDDSWRPCDDYRRSEHGHRPGQVPDAQYAVPQWPHGGLQGVFQDWPGESVPPGTVRRGRIPKTAIATPFCSGNFCSWLSAWDMSPRPSNA